MKFFTKRELIGLTVIFIILVVMSLPNFVASIKRARDQVRRDDLGTIDAGMSEYFSDYGVFPMSRDGKILGCKKPEDTVTKDAKGRLLVNLIPCEWGKSSLIDLTPGSTKVYMDKVPSDPRNGQGSQYLYLSNGARYQIFAAFEGADEIGVDAKIIARNLECGTKVCNVGRFYGCPVEKSLEQCEEEDRLKISK